MTFQRCVRCQRKYNQTGYDPAHKFLCRTCARVRRIQDEQKEGNR
jgi:recombinational DNA repair protein (RecF pathway)